MLLPEADPVKPATYMTGVADVSEVGSE